MRTKRRIILLFLTLPLVTGCGGGQSAEMADVSGTITYKGQPLANAEVFFVNDKFEGYGRTDEQGRYSLVRGAPVGACKVYITKTNPALKAAGIDLSIEGMDEEQLNAMRGTQSSTGKVKPYLPEQYSDPEKSKLQFEVPPGGTEEANFKL